MRKRTAEGKLVTATNRLLLDLKSLSVLDFMRIQTTGIPRWIGGRLQLHKNQYQKGCPDYFIWWNQNQPISVWCEAKDPNEGGLSPDQVAMHQRLRNKGQAVEVFTTIEELELILITKGLILPYKPRAKPSHPTLTDAQSENADENLPLLR